MNKTSQFFHFGEEHEIFAIFFTFSVFRVLQEHVKCKMSILLLLKNWPH